MINLLEIKRLNENEFDSKYQIFNIVKTDDTNIIKTGEPIIYSAAYETRSNFYVLVSSACNKANLLKVFPDQHYKVTKKKMDEIDQYILINLIINKQANLGLSKNNLTAELNKVYKEKKDQKVCLAFSSDKENILSFRVSTFSILNDKTKKKFTYKTQQAIDQNNLSYFVCEDGYLVRTTEKKIKNPYINRSTVKKKNNLNYFAIDFSDNKVFEMFKLIRQINNEDRSFIELGLLEMPYSRLLEEKRSNKSTYTKLRERFNDDVVINVVDYCNKKDDIKTLLDKEKINHKFSDQVFDDDLNLVIIKSSSEYKDSNEVDKHIINNQFVVQNVVYKNLNETVIRQCWLEMLVKREAIDKVIKAVCLEGRWSFYRFINKTIHHLEVEDNKIVSFSSFDLNKKAETIMFENKDKDPRIIINENGTILILNTELRLIPDWDKIAESQDDYIYIVDGKKKNKIRTSRNKYFGEAIDVNSFIFKENKYYSVGEIGYGMNKTIDNSPATKLVIEDGITIESIVNMLEPNIFQINQYAVYPYPFKIMDELFVMNGGIIND